MGEKAATFRGSWSIAAGVKEDVLADGKCGGPESAGGPRSRAIGVYSNAVEFGAESRLERNTGVGLQRLTA
jgi:hypothetical protein